MSRKRKLVFGFKELDRKLKKLDSITGTKILYKSMLQAMLPMQKTAKQIVPVDSGAMFSAISRRRNARTDKKRKKFASVSLIFRRKRGVNLSYKYKVLEGTKNMRGVDVLGIAYRVNRAGAVSRFRAQLQKNVMKAVR